VFPEESENLVTDWLRVCYVIEYKLREGMLKI